MNKLVLLASLFATITYVHALIIVAAQDSTIVLQPGEIVVKATYEDGRSDFILAQPTWYMREEPVFSVTYIPPDRPKLSQFFIYRLSDCLSYVRCEVIDRRSVTLANANQNFPGQGALATIQSDLTFVSEPLVVRPAVTAVRFDCWLKNLA